MLGDCLHDAAEVVGNGGDAFVATGVVDVDHDGADVGVGGQLLEVFSSQSSAFLVVIAVARRECRVTFSGWGIPAALARRRRILVTSWRMG